MDEPLNEWNFRRGLQGKKIVVPKRQRNPELLNKINFVETYSEESKENIYGTLKIFEYLSKANQLADTSKKTVA